MEGKGIDRPSAVDLMTWVIGGLLPKLVEFLKQENNLQRTTPIKETIESLEIQLRRMEDALVVRIPQGQQDQYYAYELRELAYGIEDIVDDLLMLLPIEEGKELAYDIERHINLLRYNEGKEGAYDYIFDYLMSSLGINQDCFRELLESIKVRVKNLAAWLAANFVATTSTVKPCLEDIQMRQLIGIHKLRDDLIFRMSSPSQQLKLVSIWGEGGMGKTTLAKAVYENIKGNFQCTAFVSVGPQPDMKKVLRDILIHLDKKRYSDLTMTMLDEGHELTVELRHFVKNKRFLIVIDDIRDIPSWEVIKCALVDNGYDSRIITTSRVLSVTESSGEVLKMMPLSIDGSKELFYATLCGRKGIINFDQLDEQTTEYILQKCGYVPLAIITIASLLAGKPQEEWSKVYKSIGFGHEDNIVAENTRKIIQFSYLDLPRRLKTCLLYLSIFPSDHVIEIDTLMWRWVAEGFVHADKEQGESLFKIGEKYLYELVSRSMIQIVEDEDANIRGCHVNYLTIFPDHELIDIEEPLTTELVSKSMIQTVGNVDTNIRGCRVESMVLDWIRTVAKEEKFVHSSEDWYGHDQHLFSHIMAFHNRVLHEPYDLDDGMWKQKVIFFLGKVRSFSGIGCSIQSAKLVGPAFNHLRVLSLECCKLIGHSYGGLEILIARLHKLRYLGLRRIRKEKGIRDSLSGIGGLRYLQTLDLTNTNIWELSSSVTQLRQLKCLRCFGLKLQVPQGMGNLTSLEELRLGTVVNGSKTFADELSKLTELRVLYVVNIDSFYGKWMEALVESLSKLQKIEDLNLFCDEPSKNKTCRPVIAPGAFPKMRHFRTHTWPMYQPGAMPCLKSVELEVNVRAFNDDNFDFHDLYKLSYLHLLQKAHVTIVCWRAKMEEVEKAEAALRHVLQSHPNHPKLILTRFGQCVDDKQICLLGGLHGSRVAPQVMPLELLRKITDDFSDKRRLGSGTFGAVYKGVLNGKEVAVKQLHSMSQRLDYEEEFMKEFENLRRLNHPNIVQLLGYCYEIKRVGIEHEGKYVLADKIDRALCFDYMHNGNLQRYLYDESCGLNWQTRYKIIKGTCEGLKYLHKGLESPMLHLDLKPGNILLDKNMVPKLADFGLSKLVIDNQTRETSSPLGTIRYCPPEHFKGYIFSNKFDIFSLGVVMIEIIAGSKGYDKTAEMPSQEFIDHVQENWRKRIHQATSGCTPPKCECYQVKRCIETALQCVHPERTERPDIGDIISTLNETENNTEKSATTSFYTFF